MKRWGKPILAIITTIVCLVTCCFTGVLSRGLFELVPWAFVGYCPFDLCAPRRPFDVLDLGLPESLFPEGAGVYPMHRPSESEGAFEKGDMIVTWNGKRLVYYVVWRYATEKKASRVYERMILSVLDGEVWSSEALHRSEIADEYTSTFSTSNFFGEYCAMGARIAEYVILLEVYGNDEESIDLFNDIVDYIDEDMGQRLNLPE
jgi:hypothetical protein